MLAFVCYLRFDKGKPLLRNAKQINQDFDLLFFPISALKSLAVTKAMPTFFALNSKKIPRLVGVKLSWFIYCAFLIDSPV